MELWLLYAVGAAVFAALTTILAKIGIKNVDSHLATAIRTVVVLLFAWLMVFIVGSQNGIADIQGRTWLLIIVSGLATGASWLCFFKALKLGNVNKVVPIDKSSTVLTILFAFIFLREQVTIFNIIGVVLIGIGTWLMLDLKKTAASDEKQNKSWLIYALLAAISAALVAIIGRMGVVDIDANLWTALRTVVVVPLSLVMVFMVGSHKQLRDVGKKSWLFLVLSGFATGASWLFFYHALQLGNASLVVPIDKLSIVLTMGFSRAILGERFNKKSLIGLFILTVGTLLPVFFTS